MNAPPMTWRHWLLLLATAASFASSILIDNVLVGQLPLFTLVAARFLLHDERLGVRKLLGVVFPGERLSANAFVGMGLILAGSLVVSGVGVRGSAAGRRTAAVH